jgi:hypothetical protein
LGVIDYKGCDEKYKSLVNKAIKWINLCKTKKAAKWDVFKYPLPNNDLYPNMCHIDGKWQELKTKIAKTNYELTDLWQVGKKHREIALKAGVYNWMDKKCNARILGINGKRAETLDKIIEINKQDMVMVSPTIIANNDYDWKTPDKIEFFVDFEFRNAVFDAVIQLPIADKSVLLFTIGVGFMHPRKHKWVFRDFTTEHLKDCHERDICEQFLKFIAKKGKKYGVDEPKCWHWSAAEPNIFRNAALRHKSVAKLCNTIKFKWCDLLKVFVDTPIVIHGCLNFKLKSIATNLYKLGFISSTWDDSMTNGQNAMIETVLTDEEATKKGVSMKSMPTIKAMIKYNETDVKVLCEIMAYIRNKHSGIKPTNNNDTKKRKAKDRAIFEITKKIKR